MNVKKEPLPLLQLPFTIYGYPARGALGYINFFAPLLGVLHAPLAYDFAVFLEHVHVFQYMRFYGIGSSTRDR